MDSGGNDQFDNSVILATLKDGLSIRPFLPRRVCFPFFGHLTSPSKNCFQISDVLSMPWKSIWKGQISASPLKEFFWKMIDQTTAIQNLKTKLQFSARYFEKCMPCNLTNVYVSIVLKASFPAPTWWIIDYIWHRYDSNQLFRVG